MSIMNAIFIDTSILDEQNYNFSSAAISAFIEAVSGREMILLLPDPTLREIKRHIKERSQKVVKALQQAKRTAPFLKKWTDWPARSDDPTLANELEQIAHDELKNFLGHFKVENLDYGNIHLEDVMNWYDSQQPPFGIGKKRKEFPDAFALAAVLVYAQKNRASVSVISKDKDFEKACALYSELLHFDSLSGFTEKLLSAERVSQVKVIIESDQTLIVKEIKEAFPSLGFYHEEDYEADIEDVEVDDVIIDKITIVRIEGNEVTITFEATVDYSAYIRADDHSTASIDSSEDWYMVWQEYRGTVQDKTEISGTSICSISSDQKSVKEILMFEIQEDSISVSELPEETFWKGED